jgi:hypothetical protein
MDVFEDCWHRSHAECKAFVDVAQGLSSWVFNVVETVHGMLRDALRLGAFTQGLVQVFVSSVSSRRNRPWKEITVL